MSKKSIQRQNPDACPLASKCGGCGLQNMTYDRQLEYKQAKEVKLLAQYGRIEKIIGMDDPYHYRNKVQAAFGLTRGNKIISGVYQSSSHRIVNVNSCMLENEHADRIIVFIRSILPQFRILPYNEDTGKGFLRHVLVKRSESTNQTMVVFVGANPIFPQKNNITKRLVAEFPDIVTVIFNVNPHKTSMVLAEKEEILYGKGYIEDILCGCRFRISAKSFYQINSGGTEILYNTAISLAAPTKDETLIDAYCGTGTIGIVASKTAGHVIGVELNPDAVRDAKTNAEINNATNTVFFCGDAGKFMREVASDGQKADTVIMDPPRAGSSKEFIDSLGVMLPKKIVYISCNPETLARDLHYIVKKGYKVKKIVPVDMFPHTTHVETVVLMARVNK